MSEIRGSLPAGGIGLGPEEYAEFVSKEYLGDYVRAGGAAVRFVVAGKLDYAYQRLKALHSEAFSWNAPDVTGLERLGTTRMRQYVRAWINEWDLVRIDPSYHPRTEVAPVTFSYAEQPDLDVTEELGDRWQ